MRTCRCIDIDILYGDANDNLMKRNGRGNWSLFTAYNVDLGGIYLYTRIGKKYRIFGFYSELYSIFIDVNLSIFKSCFVDVIEWRNNRILEVLSND